MDNSEKVLPPSHYIKAAMRSRDLTQKDLARITNRHPSDISVRLSKERITYEFATDLALVLGETPEYWKMLEVRYRSTITPDSDKDKVRRNSFTQDYPLKDMQKRGWITKTDNFAILEKEIESLMFLKGGQELERKACFKRTVKEEHLGSAEKAWLHRAWYLAQMIPDSIYKEDQFPRLLALLKTAIRSSKSVHKIADLLQLYGIRFVVVEPLPKVRIDGVSFWLDDNSPVVTLSLRFDNVGSFWYALVHELIHIKHRDKAVLPNNLDEEPTETIERRASDQAADFLVPQSRLQKFIRANRPYFSTAKINNLATELQVHPGIIVGQLQHLREIGFNTHHASMAKVRELVTMTAFTDGWGHPLPHVNYEVQS